MKKFVLKKGKKCMTWTYYNCNGLHFLESDKGDIIKVKSYISALRCIVATRQSGWKVAGRF